MQLQVFSEPRVKMIGETRLFPTEIESWMQDRGFDFWTDAPSNADALSEIAGRVCYLSFDPEKRRDKGSGQNKKYLERTVNKLKHGSITEHSFFNFAIDHVSRNLTHELIRHRVGTSISQTSSRYVDQLEHGGILGVYVPPRIAAIPDLFARWLDTVEGLAKLYQDSFDRLSEMGLEKKDARSDARHILPGGTGTCLIWGCNARELNHIFALRGSDGADPEIRRLAVALWKEVRWMNLFKHWKYNPETQCLTQGD